MARTPRYTYRLIHQIKGWRYFICDHETYWFVAAPDGSDADFATEEEARAYAHD